MRPTVTITKENYLFYEERSSRCVDDNKYTTIEISLPIHYTFRFYNKKYPKQNTPLRVTIHSDDFYSENSLTILMSGETHYGSFLVSHKTILRVLLWDSERKTKQ